MKKFLVVFLYLFISLPLLGAERVIVETNDVFEIENYRTADALIFFDLDDVVFTTEGYLGHSAWFYSSVKELTDLGVDWKDATDFMSRLDYEIKQILSVKALDARISELIRNWQKTNIVLGLTSRTSNLSEVTFRMLSDVDVNFAAEEAIAPRKSEQYSSTSKVERGVIFVSDFHSKGDIACRYLQSLPYYPSRVIFIDDKKRYLQELMEALPEHVDFVGIRYSKEDARKAEFAQR